MDDPRTTATSVPLLPVVDDGGIARFVDGPPGAVVAVLRAEADEREVGRLVEHVRSLGLEASRHAVGRSIVVVIDGDGGSPAELLDGWDAVERFFVPGTRYRLTRHEVRPHGSVVFLGGAAFGSDAFTVIAGPCSVESQEQILEIAAGVRAEGASVLRGGAFKPRTSPYDFQGLGMPGVAMLVEAREAVGIPFVTEVMSPEMVAPLYEAVDGYQVGARNMQNFDLLRALAEVDKPVVLKRGPAATIEEWLLAAEYIVSGGNANVILCERGIRAFNSTTRFTLDLASMVLVKRETHLPVIVDPSHATGDASLIAPMVRAALVAGADGVMLEVHTDPDAALSDGFQSLRLDEFGGVMAEVRALAPLVGRTVAPVPGDYSA